MGTKEKLVERFKKKPKDFTYEETIALMKEWMIKAIYQHLKEYGHIK